MLRYIRLDHLSVGLSVCLSAKCIVAKRLTRMPSGVVSGVGQGMRVLDGMVIVEGEWGILERPVKTNGDFVTRLFSTYFEDLLVCFQ